MAERFREEVESATVSITDNPPAILTDPLKSFSNLPNFLQFLGQIPDKLMIGINSWFDSITPD